MLILNQSPTRFATRFLRMIRTLCLKNALRGNVHLHKFIASKLSKYKGTVAMIKADQSFHKRHILIKISKPLLILLRMADSNQTHMDKLQFMVLMVDDHIMISMPELNYEAYLTPITELENDENEEGLGKNEPPEYL